jgi:AraC-like DNA-binding protein
LEKRDTAAGLLNPELGRHVHEAPGLEPSEALAPWVRSFWAVRWDLRGREPYRPKVVPFPAVNLVFQRGCSRIIGVSRRRFDGALEGVGQILGVSFHPGGFHAFFPRPLSELSERVLPVDAVFPGADVARLEAEVLASNDDLECVARAEAFLRGHEPRRDPQAELARRLVDRCARDAELVSVEALARTFGLSVRAVQRLFSKYVGVGAKWVVQLFRLHEAIGQLQSARPPSIAELAAALGYYDQAHFVAAFKAVAGQPPSAYVRGLSAPAPRRRTAGASGARRAPRGPDGPPRPRGESSRPSARAASPRRSG